jgi:ribokinase
MSFNPSLTTDYRIIGTAVQDVLKGIFYGKETRRIGGKALNQAVALSRLGGNVSLVTAVGNDAAAEEISHILSREKIDDGGIRHAGGRQYLVKQFLVNLEESPTGRKATVEHPNKELLRSLKEAIIGVTSDASKRPRVLSITFEVADDDLKQIWNYSKEVKSKGYEMTVIVNPAPLQIKREQRLLDGMKGVVDILIPNREEATVLLNESFTDVGAEKAAQQLRAMYGIPIVCITLGRGGCAFAHKDGSGFFSAIPVSVVDKVGASDIFVAAFERAFTLSHTVSECVAFAGLCAGLSVSRQGGFESAPRPVEIARYIKNTLSFPGRDESIEVLKSIEGAHYG